MSKRLIPLAVLLLAGCGASLDTSDGQVFTLYRDSAIDASMRIHVATFDAENGEPYNRENCDIAKNLFLAQSGVQVKYWCEKGRYKK
jgi:hypothetical protein